ncbi:phosphotransferase family protein [Nitriliruptoraceae bacterium ZYF776]|nr:phosphotransferase family protein [Profundirhabdus halotolerans]
MNEPRAVRDEDAFDVEAAHRWLVARVPELGGPAPAVRQFSGGASNLTYLLAYPDRELVLRRPPPGAKAASAHDVRREHDVQAALRPVFPYVPEMVAFCGEEAVLGSDFYVMERVRGTILRRDLPPELEGDPTTTRRVCEAVVDRLVDLHAVDPASSGLDRFARGEGYVARQVDGWTQRYRAARTWNVPRFEDVTAWLAANQPPDAAQAVIHNDWRFDNVVLAPDDPSRVVGVLDWEMATVGDPLMDLGAALAYWVQADDGRAFQLFRRQPTPAAGMLTRAEVVERYLDRSGLHVDDWRFYEVYGLFRLAAIIQQIYVRYRRRETRNPAFRNFWAAVHVLHHRCRRTIRTGSAS